MRKTLLGMIAAAASFGASTAYGQDAKADVQIEQMRKDARSAKKQAIAANLELSDGEAERFWPVYDRFAGELAKINDRRVALIKEYAAGYGAVSEEQAERFLEQRASIEGSALALRVRYIPLFRKVLSAKSTALLFQLEWRMNVMLESELAAEIPLIEP